MINAQLVNFMIHKLDEIKFTISKADFYAENAEKEQLRQELLESKLENEKLKQENEQLKQLFQENKNPTPQHHLNNKKIRHYIKKMNNIKYGKYNEINRKIISDMDNLEYSPSKFCMNHYNEINYKTKDGNNKKTCNSWDECEIEVNPEEWKILNTVIKK